ncbi:winged helix-turn-helix domain-containing protein [Enterococcus casseliflavus]|nr:winged helix-turn-helix domain-containing protein [Enterococcus casseliflavus]
MKKILFLTKNILVDQKFQNELQQLSFEVFCSSNLLERLLEDVTQSEIIGIIDGTEEVLLSDTISDKEAFFLLKRLQPYSLPVIRKDILAPTEDLIQEWSAYGLKGWIHSETTKSEVRELLVSFEEVENIERRPQQRKLIMMQDVPNFSRSERLLIDILCQNPQLTVSRSEICEKLWKGDVTNSNLSHLSLLINKLKSKFEQIGFASECIGTIWGKGYQVNQEVADWWVSRIE